MKPSGAQYWIDGCERQGHRSVFSLAVVAAIAGAMLTVCGCGRQGEPSAVRHDRQVASESQAKEPAPPPVPSAVVAQAARPPASGPLVFDAVAIGPRGAVLKGAPSAPTFHSEGSLRSFIGTAYDVTKARMRGGPAWMDDLDWKVLAASSRPSLSYADFRAMLRHALEDRFQLKAVKAATPTPTIALSLEQPQHPPGLRRAPKRVDCTPFLNDHRLFALRFPQMPDHTPLCGGGRMADTSYHFRSVPLSVFAHYLEIMLGQVVIAPSDKGLFDIDFECPAGAVFNDPSPDVDAYLAALHEQLGIDARIRTARVDVLTIQSASRPK
jgi:uncharacterized protein (TIGR03435 family)